MENSRSYSYKDSESERFFGLRIIFNKPVGLTPVTLKKRRKIDEHRRGGRSYRPN